MHRHPYLLKALTMCKRIMRMNDNSISFYQIMPYFTGYAQWLQGHTERGSIMTVKDLRADTPPPTSPLSYNAHQPPSLSSIASIHGNDPRGPNRRRSKSHSMSDVTPLDVGRDSTRCRT